MKAVQVFKPGGLEQLKIVDFRVRDPLPDEVLVRWHATSINYHDYLVSMGSIPVNNGRIPMSDGAGEIVNIGDNVNQWQIGDRVMSLFFPKWLEGKASMEKMIAINGETTDGFICEESCVPADSLTRIPHNYSYQEAACLPCAGLTAWRALIEEGRLHAGQSVLIQGSGGMSLWALEIAKAAGAKIYATTSSEFKAQKLLALGVEKVFNYKTDNNWGKNIFLTTNGGVDHVLDVGGGSTIYHSIESVKIGGHISSIGILGDGRKGTITFPKLFFKQVRLQGIAVGSRAMQESMIRMVNHTNIKPVIDKVFAFDQLVEAFKYQESQAHFGKIVLAW